MNLRSRIDKLAKQTIDKEIPGIAIICIANKNLNQAVINHPQMNFKGTIEEYEKLKSERKHKNNHFTTIYRSA